MDVDPEPLRGETSQGPPYETGYRPTGAGLGTIAEEDPQVYETPLESPFDTEYPTQQARDQPPTNHTEGIRTENFYTPLYTEPQDTDPTAGNDNHPPSTHEDARNTTHAAASAVEAANTEHMDTEAAVAEAADITARQAAEAEAAANAASKQAAEEASAAAATGAGTGTGGAGADAGARRSGCPLARRAACERA